jgi:aspartyl aminopeptidase
MAKSKFNIVNTRYGVDASQLIRVNPSIDKLSATDKNKMMEFSENYMNFLDKVRIPGDVVSVIEERYDLTGGEGYSFYTNPEKSAFALIREGRKPMKDGIRVLYAHNDTPCLKLKPNPLLFEWDPDVQLLHNGVELDTFAYGGIHPYQWSGRSLDVVGWVTTDDGKRRNVKFGVYSPDVAPHTDSRSDDEEDIDSAHLEESLDLDTGYPTLESFLKSIDFEEADFPRSKLYAVPDILSKKIGQYLISGFGHDNRVGVFSSVRALLDYNDTPEYTTMVFGFDLEEVGSKGPGGAGGKFFDEVFNREIIDRGEVNGLENLTEALRLNIFSKSLAINADVDLSASSRDSDKERIDKENIAKFGLGPSINCSDGSWEGDQVSPLLINKIMTVLNENKVVFQLTGAPVLADKAEDLATMNCFFDERGFPTINVGVPTASMHSPEELIHEGDLYQTYKAYLSLIKES